MEFNSNSQNPQDAAKRLHEKRFKDGLAKKYQPKSWANENRWFYHISIVGIGLGMIINMATGFAFLSPFLQGLFGASTTGTFLSTALCATLLALIEYAALVNADRFWTAHFSGWEMRTGNLVTQILLTTSTVLMAYHGAPTFAQYIHPTPQAIEGTYQSEAEISAIYEPQIKSAERSRDQFFSARSWLGKLSVQDMKEYNRLNGSVMALRNEMSNAVKDCTERNNLERDQVTAANLAAKSKNESDQSSTGQKLALFSIVVAFMVQFLLNRKERYEHNVYLEMTMKGATPSSNGNGNGHFKEFQGMGKQ